MAKDCSKRRRSTRSDLKNHDESTTTIRPSMVNEIDIISTLPDCLLCHILSFLPGKTTSVVATTSVLSRRWRYVWKDLPTFHFTLARPYNPSNPLETFLSLRTARIFRKFHLDAHITENELSTVQSWIESAMGPTLEELQVYFSVIDIQKPLIPLPIFRCTALVTISFCRCFSVLNHSSYHLPSLKTMTLHLESSNNIEALLSGCPVLEFLKLDICQICPNPNPNPNKETIRVASSSLKILDINAIYIGVVIIEEVKIDAPSLEYLHLNIPSSQLEEVSAGNLQKVQSASLIFSYVYGGYSLIELLKEIRNQRMMLLTLSEMDSIALPTYQLMEFNHLFQLHLTVQNFSSKVVMDMLGKCRVLKDLKIVRKQKGESQGWTEPVDVPNCLVSHLEYVVFDMCLGSEEEKEFIAYILQKGLILKGVSIYADPMGFNVEEELSLIPRASNTCYLRFHKGISC
ncbi:hypothetical protein PIB30_057731 [Stylosanthes scabra]|uniref:FBD domain-containing protein n=1 Tax=Stylosanthes scabra TaxID=79078 RepID=A0ABU6SK35_9FABA|nr:hypothetical protein [Stylosanthes scabra]